MPQKTDDRGELIIGTVVSVKDEHETKLTSDGPEDVTKYRVKIKTQDGRVITLVSEEPMGSATCGEQVKIAFAFGAQTKLPVEE
jgi:hypothetical protein